MWRRMSASIGGSAIDGRVATLAMDVNEEKSLKPGYKLKFNSYDLGVDIELHDVLQRIALRASGSCLRGGYECEGADFLRGRKYLYARNLLARVESEFLQIYE